MGQLTVQAFRSLHEVHRLGAQLDALNLASRRPCPFSTLEYLEAFLAFDEYGTKEREVLFLTASEAGRLVGYLPLRKHVVRELGVVPYHRIGVLVSHDTDRPHVVARAEDEGRCAQAFWDWLLQHEHGWSLVELSLQDSESALYDVPRHDPFRFWARRFPNMPISRLVLDPAWAGVPDYLMGALDSHQRKTLNRSVRRTLDAGRAELVSCSDPAGRRELLELYLGIERRSWKHAAKAGISRDERRVAFFRALCDERQPAPLTVQLVMLDDLPISGVVTATFGGVLHGLEMCFDQDYEELGCGHLAALAAFRQALRTGVREVNLNGNYGYNKSRFGCAPTETWAVQVYKVGSPPWLRAQAGLLRAWLRKPPAADQAHFNPERRAHEQHVGARPAHTVERAQVRATLALLEARGVRLERLAGADLEAEFSPTKGRPHERAAAAGVDRDADVQPKRHHRSRDPQHPGAALR
ncbi:MAG: GNAT family N-acetyltransferase [Myxococcota bacterium]